MKELAIVGSTASGKSDLALAVAKSSNCVILSLDSLSIYKEIDIASAKPSQDELEKISHFAVNEIYVNQPFNVVKFFDFYQEAKKFAIEKGKNLVIVGGSSFYLKMLINGISNLPETTPRVREEVEKQLKDLSLGYRILQDNDPIFAEKIKPNDRYRIEKALIILFSTNTTPSLWYKENGKEPIVKDLAIFNIETPREVLRERVTNRTAKMFQQGILDEASFLEKKYGLNHPPLHSIGLKECYQYLNGRIGLAQCKDLVVTHTMQLAKRQKTFNRHQFDNIITMPLEKLEDEIKRHIFC